jgi:hypothetical protein
MIENATLSSDKKSISVPDAYDGKDVFVDYYVTKTSNVTELQIDAETFAGYYYVEAATLFKKEDTGIDMPAEIILPKVKIQSNFNFSMASTGDPSTFTFTMDAFPDYTMFNPDKKVLCAIQIINEDARGEIDQSPVTVYSGNDLVDVAKDDSVLES